LKFQTKNKPEQLGLGFRLVTPSPESHDIPLFLISNRLDFLTEEGPAQLEPSPTGIIGTLELGTLLPKEA
jgi:hypothetical protein